jgi:hypothetical protein
MFPKFSQVSGKIQASFRNLPRFSVPISDFRQIQASFRRVSETFRDFPCRFPIFASFRQVSGKIPKTFRDIPCRFPISARFGMFNVKKRKET